MPSVHKLALALAATALIAACGGGGGEDIQEPLALAGDTAAAAARSGGAAAAPPLAARPRSTPEERYIVRFKPGAANVRDTARVLAAHHGGTLQHVYEHALQGFSLALPEAAVPAFLAAMENHPMVDLVEPDAVATGAQTVQAGATWGLDRVDQRALPLSGTYSYLAGGTGVRAYIVDSGIRASHSEFEGRVASGYTAINDGWGTGDCNGHGTHVAGTVGGRTWGVAKGVTLVPVRVLGCDGSGYVSGIIAGLDWMVANLVRPAVANLSVQAGASSTLDAAVARAVGSGVTVAVAAGNNNVDACTASPSREPSALTVGATTGTDYRASYSNWGTCLDLFAPGSAITSAGIGSDLGSAVMNGTSMATPHVAGAAAAYLQQDPLASPAAVGAALKAGATANAVLAAGAGSPNLLLYSLLAAEPIAGEPVPTASMAVASLAGSAYRQSSGWRAVATVGVRDAAGAPVPGVVVTGSFSYGGSGLACTTNTAGTCSVTSGRISASKASTRFAVDNLVRSGMVYDRAADAASSVLIAKP